MTSLALAHPTVWRRIEIIWGLLAPSLDLSAASDDPQEDSRNRRDFFLEMLNRNPNAFQNELDVQNMMHSYPGRF